MVNTFRSAIEETLPWLSSIGADPTGNDPLTLFAGVAGNPAKIKTGMTDDGYQTRFDEVGNLYGRLEGSRYPKKSSSAVRILIPWSTAAIWTDNSACWLPGLPLAG
jgi:hypothetical protein